VRFCLIDRIEDLQAGESIVATKNLSIAEEYLADHFPGFPIMPGVMMVESLVQAGAWLMRYTENFEYSTVLLKEARAVRFNNFVRPGQTLHVECTIQKRDGAQYTMKGVGTVNGESAISAKLTLEQFNLANHNARLGASDARRTQAMRELFGSLWTPPA
jgi:3-hydroxyacyl-[acyl-carrier-protein] dehydratase